LVGRRPAGAIRCEGSGHIASHARLRAALHGAIAAGGGVLHPRAAQLAREPNGRCVVVGEAAYDLVVLAAGIGSRALAEGLGHTVPMVPERGYHLHAPGKQWPAALPPVVFEDRSMIVTGFEDGVRAASFVELAPLGRPADPAKWDVLRRHLAALNLPFGKNQREWMGARPTLPDYLPAIGRSHHAANLVYAFGHQHLGLTLAPVTAGLVADLALGRAPAVDLAPFDLARFEKGARA
jgi:glycine/D-amino acid oxidase-like deaminating enzyme